MTLSELLSLLTNLGTRPKKKLSQNFLVDPNISRKIIQTAKLEKQDTVLEIGPGPGALTAMLLEAGNQVIAVEMDKVFAKALHRLQNGHLTVFEKDFLKFPLTQLPKHIKVVANLPYHITSLILEKLFSISFSSITVMVQKEVAERMMAKAGTKEYGALSIFVQFYTTPLDSFVVSPNCFYPAPKVDSTVIHLGYRKAPDVDPEKFFSLVHRGFQQRRKMLSSSLPIPKDKTKEALLKIGSRADARPEALSLDAWVALTKELEEFIPQHEK